MFLNQPKVIRDGKVAVIYSPGYGAGWYSWNTNHPQCLTDPNIVEMIENDKKDSIKEYCERVYGQSFYCSEDKLEIAWLDEGQAFKINEYDGYESIQTTFDDWFSL